MVAQNLMSILVVPLHKSTGSVIDLDKTTEKAEKTRKQMCDPMCDFDLKCKINVNVLAMSSVAILHVITKGFLR